MIDKKYLPHAVFLMLCLIWGSTWVVIKIGLQEAPPFLSAGARFLIAVLLLYALMKIRGLKLPKDRRALMLMIYTGTFAVSLAYGLVYWAEQHVAAGLTAVLFSSFPFFVIIYSHFMIANDRLTKMKIIGSCIGFGGVVLIYLDSLRIDNVFVLVGASAIVVSAICTAFSNVVIKKNFDILDPVVLSVVQMTCGAVTLLAIGFIFEDPANFRLTLTSLASLFYLAVVGSCIAFIGYYWLVKQIKVTTASLVILVIPIVALFLDWLVFGEILNWRIFAGSTLVISGVGLASR